MNSRTAFEAEYPFTSHVFDLDGLRYHYVDEGPRGAEGETLLCVHGNPTWSFAWRHFVQELSPRYRVLAVDHIGCGFSDKPQEYEYRLATHIENLCRFIEGLNLQRVTLIAHDWGGAIGMGAAARLPERFSRFVLMNTAAFRSQQIPFRIAICRWPLFGTLALRGANAFSRAALTMAVSRRDRISEPIRAGYLTPYDNWANRVAVQRFVQDIPLAPGHPSYATLVEVEQGLAQFRKHPVLLPWGLQDWCFTPKFLKEFESRFPEAETFPLPRAGHYIFEDAWEEVVPRIRRFLDEHPLSAQSSVSASG